MIIHTDSVRYIWEVFEQGEYSFFLDKLRVLDLGCNVGAFSLWIYPKIEQIWAVDCDEKYLDNFKETIKANELKGITLYKDRVLDLEDFMKGHSINNVDLLKIDIEGDEYEVFSKPFPKIPLIIGEYHIRPDQVPVENLLTQAGYRYFEMPNNHFIARI